MRQVNGWGFKRIVSGNDHNSYYHEMFLRDYPQLCLKMKRIRKGDKVSEAIEDEKDEKSNEGGEPNEEGGSTEKNEGEGEEDKQESDEEGSEEQNSSSAAAKETGDNSARATSGTLGDGNNQNQGAVNADLSALSGMAAQFQNQQAPAPAGSGIGGLDQSALMKLQEALQGGTGSNLLQQQQSGQQQMPLGIAGLNMGNLGNLGGALAAQLQQATQVSC